MLGTGVSAFEGYKANKTDMMFGISVAASKRNKGDILVGNEVFFILNFYNELIYIENYCRENHSDTLIKISLAFVQRIELNFGLGVWTSAEVTKERSQVGTTENKLFDRCLSKKGGKSETLHLSS